MSCDCSCTKEVRHSVICIHVPNQPVNGPKMFEVITKYSKSIRTCLGLNFPERNGALKIVELQPGACAKDIIAEVEAIGLEVKLVTF